MIEWKSLSERLFAKDVSNLDFLISASCGFEHYISEALIPVAERLESTKNE